MPLLFGGVVVLALVPRISNVAFNLRDVKSSNPFDFDKFKSMIALPQLIQNPEVTLLIGVISVF